MHDQRSYRIYNHPTGLHFQAESREVYYKDQVVTLSLSESTIFESLMLRGQVSSGVFSVTRNDFTHTITRLRKRLRPLRCPLVIAIKKNTGIYFLKEVERKM